VEDFQMPLFLAPKLVKNLFPFFSSRARRIVERLNLPYKKGRGWWLESGEEPVWHGYYRTKYGPSYKGKVECLADPKFYIRFPQFPPQLRGHRHEYCFRLQPNTDNWYWVHMSPVSHDVDSGIFAVERTLNDVLAPAPLKKSA
jgi:hypothetical protein